VSREGKWVIVDDTGTVDEFDSQKEAEDQLVAINVEQKIHQFMEVELTKAISELSCPTVEDSVKTFAKKLIDTLTKRQKRMLVRWCWGYVHFNIELTVFDCKEVASKEIRIELPNLPKKTKKKEVGEVPI